MTTRIPTPLFFHLAVLLGWGVIFAANCSAGDFSNPKYGGIVQPISTPVVVQYRPFSKVPMTAKTIMQISTNGEKQFETVILDGAFEGKRRNGGVQLTFEVDRIVKTSPGIKETQEVRVLLSVFVNANGDTEDVKLEMPGLDTSNSKTQHAIRFFESLLEKTFPKLPNEGVIVGDRLYDLNLNQQMGNGEIGISGSELVRGRSHFEGRHVLVTEVTGTFHFKSPEGQIEFPMRGFSLIDIDTGIHFFFDFTASGSGSIKGKDIIFEMRQTRAVGFPPISAQGPAFSNRAIQQRLERVKRLLDEGLITPDEAAEKRKEILNSL